MRWLGGIFKPEEADTGKMSALVAEIEHRLIALDGDRGSATQPGDANIVARLQKVIVRLSALDDLTSLAAKAEQELVGKTEHRRGITREPLYDRFKAIIAALRQDVEPGPFRASAASVLMNVRDRLVMDSAEAPSRRWLTEEVTRALNGVGVSVIEDTGPLKETRHEVVDFRNTGDPAQHEHIAETVRVGYASEEALLRPQQVIAWTNDEHGREGASHA